MSMRVIKSPWLAHALKWKASIKKFIYKLYGIDFNIQLWYFSFTFYREIIILVFLK